MANKPTKPVGVETFRLTATRDLNTARSLFELGSEHYGFVAFCCQQSIEKHLKALISSKGDTPKYTHDLESLAVLASEAHPSVSSDLRDLSFLTVFAVQWRYTEDLVADDQIVEAALAAAQRVTLVVEQVLGPLAQRA